MKDFDVGNILLIDGALWRVHEESSEFTLKNIKIRGNSFGVVAYSIEGLNNYIKNNYNIENIFIYEDGEWVKPTMEDIL